MIFGPGHSFVPWPLYSLWPRTRSRFSGGNPSSGTPFSNRIFSVRRCMNVSPYDRPSCKNTTPGMPVLWPPTAAGTTLTGRPSYSLPKASMPNV